MRFAAADMDAKKMISYFTFSSPKILWCISRSKMYHFFDVCALTNSCVFCCESLLIKSLIKIAHNNNIEEYGNILIPVYVLSFSKIDRAVLKITSTSLIVNSSMLLKYCLSNVIRQLLWLQLEVLFWGCVLPKFNC